MVLTTTYFPSLRWIEAQREGATIEAHENYQKQSSRNRCRIMTAGGVQCLTVPVVHGAGRKVAIQDTRIDWVMPWQRTHARAVMAAYRSAPYWEHFQDAIMPLFDLHETFLLDLNTRITTRLLEILKLNSSISFTTKFEAVAQEPPPIISVPYYQVFADRYPFAENLSVVDAIFCEGRLPSEE
ncbi:MAG: WbqC family protein [Mucinivorans sp.]